MENKVHKNSISITSYYQVLLDSIEKELSTGRFSLLQYFIESIEELQLYEKEEEASKLISSIILLSFQFNKEQVFLKKIFMKDLSASINLSTIFRESNYITLIALKSSFQIFKGEIFFKKILQKTVGEITALSNNYDHLNNDTIKELSAAGVFTDDVNKLIFNAQVILNASVNILKSIKRKLKSPKKGKNQKTFLYYFAKVMSIFEECFNEYDKSKSTELITSIFFLRFFSPMICNLKKYKLISKNLNETQNKRVIYLAKLIQAFANNRIDFEIIGVDPATSQATISKMHEKCKKIIFLIIQPFYAQNHSTARHSCSISSSSSKDLPGGSGNQLSYLSLSDNKPAPIKKTQIEKSLEILNKYELVNKRLPENVWLPVSSYFSRIIQHQSHFQVKKYLKDIRNHEKANYGFILEPLEAHASIPHLFGLLWSLQYEVASIHMGGIHPIEKELIQIIVSTINKCELCVQLHSLSATNYGLPSSDIQNIIHLITHKDGRKSKKLKSLYSSTGNDSPSSSSSSTSSFSSPSSPPRPSSSTFTSFSSTTSTSTTAGSIPSSASFSSLSSLSLPLEDIATFRINDRVIKILEWVAVSNCKDHELLSKSPPFSRDDAPEIMGAAVLKHYFNRITNTFLKLKLHNHNRKKKVPPPPANTFPGSSMSARNKSSSTTSTTGFINKKKNPYDAGFSLKFAASSLLRPFTDLPVFEDFYSPLDKLLPLPSPGSLPSSISQSVSRFHSSTTSSHSPSSPHSKIPTSQSLMNFASISSNHSSDEDDDDDEDHDENNNHTKHHPIDDKTHPSTNSNSNNSISNSNSTNNSTNNTVHVDHSCNIHANTNPTNRIFPASVSISTTTTANNPVSKNNSIAKNENGAALKLRLNAQRMNSKDDSVTINSPRSLSASLTSAVEQGKSKSEGIINNNISSLFHQNPATPGRDNRKLYYESPRMAGTIPSRGGWINFIDPSFKWAASNPIISEILCRWQLYEEQLVNECLPKVVIDKLHAAIDQWNGYSKFNSTEMDKFIAGLSESEAIMTRLVVSIAQDPSRISSRLITQFLALYPPLDGHLYLIAACSYAAFYATKRIASFWHIPSN